MIHNVNLIDASGIFHRVGYFSSKYGGSSSRDQISLALKFVNESRYLLENAYNKSIWLLDSPNRNYWRNEYYPDYKAGRVSNDDQQSKHVVANTFIEDAKTYDYKYLQFENFEADDLAGGLVRLIGTMNMPDGCRVNLITGDSDWQGLVSDKVRGIYPLEPCIRTVDEVYNWLSRKWAKQSKSLRSRWELPSRSQFNCSDIWHWKQAVGDSCDNLKAGSDIGVFSLLEPSYDLYERLDFRAEGAAVIKTATPYLCDLRLSQEYLGHLLEPPIPMVRVPTK